MLKFRIFAAIAAMLALGACAAGPKLSTVDDPETGVHYVTFTGAVDRAGGPRVSAIQAWQPVPGPYGRPIYVLRSDDAGSGYGTGQTAVTALAGSLPQAVGIAAAGALTRPSNISVSQGGAVAVSRSRGGSAISNSSSSASSSSSSAAAACGSFYGC